MKMKDEITKILMEILYKIDKLIILMKLSNKKAIDEFKKQIKKDKISNKILEYADGSLSYTDISKKVAEELGVAEITVKKKISDLKEVGVLITKRVGKEVYYQNSGLLD